MFDFHRKEVPEMPGDSFYGTAWRVPLTNRLLGWFDGVWLLWLEMSHENEELLLFALRP